jgi:serine/threonine protein kinase
MASSLNGNPDSQVRLVSDEEAVVIPENARPSDDTPTVISKTQPIVEPVTGIQDKFTDLSRKPATPESIVAGLRGRKLAHYELIEPIGVGGMAAVIRARDTQLDRFVALKILPPEMAKENDNVQRFHQEAKAAAKLDHANIARVFYCGEDQGLYFIAFEFVEGMNLRSLMEKRGKLPVAESIRYILQIAAGLEHASTRGVVHRDVKPSNIIITPHGQAKLVDMGLARNLERHGERDLTQSGMTLGTFDYISPEQALEPREADARSDIYSLGCTLYHMLTGIPPVPDGTPAKKLQHHQHHAPVDPRQFNPDIPDEIVMILGKMMAKNPKDRYQRPIHLVQHLMQVAQKVGAANDLPEGVLLVDAELPGQPRSRPVLVIGLALATLAVVTFLISFATKPNFVENPPAHPEQIKVAKGNPEIDKGGPRPEIIPDEPLPEIVSTPANLQRILNEPTLLKVKANVGAILNLESAGFTYRGRSDQQIILESVDPDNPDSVIKFKYTETGSPIGIALEGGEHVVFRRIRFEIDAESTPERAAAGIAVRGTKSVSFEKCLFVQKAGKFYAGSTKVPLASILIDAPKGFRPIVNLTDCYFDGIGQNRGQVAVAINGPATVNVSNCAFRPHAAFFSFRDKCSKDSTSLDLQNCFGFLEMSPALRFSANASAMVGVQHSVFSRPVSEVPDRDASPGLIYLSGDTAISYKGRQNLYHNLNSLLQQKDGLKITRADEFKNYLAQNNGEDVKSVHLDQATSPLQHASPLAQVEKLSAFQLTSKYHYGYGLRTSWTGEMQAPQESIAIVSNKKTVDADKLNEALIGAKDGDVISIKHGENRIVVLQSVALKPGISVKLKPDEGCQPILILDKDFEEKESTLFKVQKSKLHFENLEFLLDPDVGYEKRSIVQMGESAKIIFERCTFTLKATNKVELSVATFLDLDKTMKMDTTSPLAAHLEFHECFVRGKGDLVSLQGCRRLDVKLTNSLVVLDGNLLDITASSKSMPMNQGVNWTMEHSSIFTTEPLFALRSAPGTVLTETQAKIKDCLLVSLMPEQDFVTLGMSRDVKLSKYLKWECEHNFYANFEKEKLRDWETQFPEIGSKSNGLTFSPKLNDEAKRALWDATPDLFKPVDAEKLMLNGIGIPPESEEKLLPAPTIQEP